jgi:hypothetical protein
MRFEELTAETDWPPSRNGMPELGDFTDDCFQRYVFACAWEEPTWLTHEEHWLTANLARLVDKAVREYRAASACLDVFVTDRSAPRPDFFGPAETVSVDAQRELMRAVDHLENCIDATRRALGFVHTDAFRTSTNAQVPVLLTELNKPIRRLRDAIQHANRDLDEGKVEAGDPVFVAVTSDAAYLGGEVVLFAELGSLIMMLWLFMSEVIGDAPPGQSPTAAQADERRDPPSS